MLRVGESNENGVKAFVLEAPEPIDRAVGWVLVNQMMVKTGETRAGGDGARAEGDRARPRQARHAADLRHRPGPPVGAQVMSLSLVRTCDRCGTRSEKRVLTLDDVRIAVLCLQFMQAMPDGGAGCYECMPDLVEGQTEDQRLDWKLSVERAYSHPPRPTPGGPQ